MGRLTMFDELHDLNPPEPGMREFARVATRAKAIRRRRATLAMRLSLLVVLAVVLGTTWAWLGGPPRVTRDPVGPSTPRSRLPPSSAVTSSTSAAAVEFLPLSSPNAAATLAAIDLHGESMTAQASWGLVSLHPGPDGGLCL